MDLLSELRQAVQDDLTVGEESSLYPPALIDRFINRAYRKIGAMYKWTETKDAKKTNAIAGDENYDYPTNWRPESIWRIEIDGIDHGTPLTFDDYQFEKANSYPSGYTKMWANYGKQFFIYPTPTVTGDKNISIFGYKFVDALTSDSDITIFSYSIPNVNEAIVLEACAMLKNKGNIDQPQRSGVVVGSTLLSQEAKGIVVTEWSKIIQEKAKYARTTPMFDVPDMFGSTLSNRRVLRNRIGDF